MFRRLRGESKKSDNGGSTSRDAAQARGLPAELEGQEKEIKSSVMPSQGTSISTNQQTVAKPILKIRVGGDRISTVAFLKEGKHVLRVEGDRIQQWELTDGEKVGIPMDARGWVHDMVASRDGKWIVSGSDRGVSVWNAEFYNLVGEMRKHTRPVYAVDISPDGLSIASGSLDKTACIWLRRTNERRLRLSHNDSVNAVRFSPDGRLLATATENGIRVYDSKDGRLLFNCPVDVAQSFNQSLAWNDNEHFYAISASGIIYYVDLGEIPSQWLIRTDGARNRGCIALSSNRRFIAVSDDSSASFWDTTTRTKICPDIKCNLRIGAMAISENYDIAIGHGMTITFWNLSDILPSEYLHNPIDINSTDRIPSPATRANQSSESVEELKNKLAMLQGRYETQSQELTSAKKEVETLKSSTEAKDKKIDALAAEVDYWKCAEAAKAEELIAVHEELQFSQSQTIAVRKWYDDQYRQLKSIVEGHQSTPFLVHNFISQADARAETNIIETLERLNETIQWSATFITDRVIHDFQPLTTNPTEEQFSITKRVADTIGQPLVNRLRSNSRTEVVAYLPVALRAYLVYHLHDITSSWSIDSGPNQFIRELYTVVRKIESQTISGRWRSLTYASLSPTCSSNPERFIDSLIDRLSDIVFVAGCAASTSAAKEMVTSKFRGRVSLILTTTGQLSQSIMDTLSADYRVETARPTVMLDDQTMEIDSTGRGIQSGVHRVLCTTQMGLSKEVITQSGTGPNKKNTLTATNVVKAKVLLG